MAQFIADEHFPEPVARVLRSLGHTVTSVRHYGDSKSGDGLSDDQVLQIANDHRSAVLTRNVKHFKLLHKSHPWHSGIIACSFNDDESPRTLAKRIDKEIKAAGRLTGQWIRILRKGSDDDDE